MEDEAFVEAEVFVTKASPFINSVTDIAILLRYRATFAKVLDSNRKFIEAAERYYELSTTTNANVSFVVTPSLFSVNVRQSLDRSGRFVGVAREGGDLCDPRQDRASSHASAGTAREGAVALSVFFDSIYEVCDSIG